MIRLEIQDLQWIKGSADDPTDQCAHGRVQFEVNNTVFVRPGDGLWTVSAAALYLLRTLTEEHTRENSVADGFLFPCCGFNIWLVGSRFKVACQGCSNGIDVEITHSKGYVTITRGPVSESVTDSAWREVVISFATKVREFYLTSTPKVAVDDELGTPGWAAFWQEWDDRYANATSPPA